MTRLTIRLLGPFWASHGDQPLKGFESDKSRGLLAYLVSEPNKSHRREMLAAILWPDWPEQTARTNLRRTLANLRKVIGDHDATPPYLRITRQEIQFNELSDAYVDLIAFRRQLVDSDDPSVNIEQLQETISLVHGPFLEGFTVKDSALFEEWALLTREKLTLQVQDLLQKLGNAYERQGAYGDAIKYARRQLELEPWREEAHRQVMRLLALSDQRAAALAQYELCRELLARELNIKPDPETALLYEQIQAGEVAALALPRLTRTIGGYEIRERIGAGHFGVVYRAYQPHVGRDVAIKVIQPHFANQAEFIRRFESEAQLVARLEHPHIVPLYDFWREPSGAYLVMRWLRGGTLERAITRGLWNVEPIASLVDQLASALTVAHNQGVIHRDIKPANILLDDEGNAYLSDFGIAKGWLGSPVKVMTAAEDGSGGSSAYVSPEQEAQQVVGPASDIYSLGLVIYVLLTGKHPGADNGTGDGFARHDDGSLSSVQAVRPDLPPAVDAVIQRATAEDPKKRFPHAIALAASFRQALLGETLETDELSVGGIDSISANIEHKLRNPYKGLRPFEEIDSADFFGRENLVNHLLERIGEFASSSLPDRWPEDRFLAVIGPSGSGKSSVVRAGLIPALRRGALPGSEKWFIVGISPGTHPMEELEIGLLRIATRQLSGLIGHLKRDDRGLLRASRLVMPDDNSQLLLFVDQFEETFTLVEDREEADLFMASLYAAVTDARSNLRIIITLRADYYDRPLAHPEFSKLLREKTAVVVPLTADELSRAVSEPAASAGIQFEEGLIPTIVADLAKQPGSLPLLQYTLTELFDRRRSSSLSLAAYQSIGGVAGAIAARADELYGSLNKSGQNVAWQLFMRLIGLREGAVEGVASVETRRRVKRTELTRLLLNDGKNQRESSAAIIEDVIDAFGKFRLLTFDRDPVSREPTVEIAHEALLREWPRLVRWLDESRADLRLQRVLANAVTEWLDTGRDSGFLLHGSRLDQFAGWAENTRLALTRDEQVFLEASLAESRKLEAEEVSRQARESALERRSVNRLRLLVVVMAVAMSVAILLTFLTLNQRGVAQQQARQATARELASLAIGNLTIDPERSVLLAMESVSQTYVDDGTVVPEALDALHQSLMAIRLTNTFSGTNAVSCTGGIWCSAVSFSPDGRYLATSGQDEEVVIWDVKTAENLLVLTGLGGAVTAVSFDPEGEQLAIADSSGTAVVWDISSLGGGSPLNISPEDLRKTTLSGHSEEVVSVDFSPDGGLLATSSRDNQAKVWDLAQGVEKFTLAGHDGSVRDVAFTPDGSHLITGGSDMVAIIWDLANGEAIRRLTGHSDRIFDVSVSPDSSQLATASRDGSARIWDLHGEAEPIVIASPGDHGGPIYAVAYSPDGRYLATGGVDALAKVWAVEGGRELISLAGHEGTVVNLEFSPDGRRLATGSLDGTVKLWDVTREGSREWITLADHTDVAFDVAYSRSGDRLGTTSFDGTAMIWDAETGQRLLTLADHEGRVAAISFSPDDALLATASFDGTAMIWDSATGQRLAKLIGHQGPVVDITFTKDGQEVVTAGADATARMWKVDSGQEIRTLTGHEGGLERVAVSPDGNFLATAGVDGTVRIWLLASGHEIYRFIGHEGPVLGLSYSNDGQLLVTTSGDRSVKLWDLTALPPVQLGDGPIIIDQVLLTLTGHNSDVWNGVFSPDGRTLATISFDGTARLWDVPGAGSDGELGEGRESAGSEVLKLDGGNDGRDLAFSPDGRFLATTSGNGIVRVYVLPIEDLMALAEERVTRALTTAECQKFMHLEQCAVGR